MKRLFLISFVLAIVFIMAGSNSVLAQTINLKLAIHVPPQHYASKAFEQWIGELAKRSGGKVKVTLYPGQSLGKIPDEWNMLKSGISDIGWILPMYYPGTFPLADVTDLPYLMPEGKRDLSIINGIFDKFLNKQFEEVKVLWPGWMGFPQLHTKKPVSKIEDLKGKQIRCPPGPLLSSIQALGATPVQIPSPEVYNALERGIVDGCVIPWEGCKAFKFYEVAKYHTVADLGCGMNVSAMNMKTWNSLPPDIQKIFLELSPWAQKLFNDSANAEDENAISAIKKAGNTIIYLSPEEKARWMEATKSVIDAWADKINGRGLPGTAIVEEMHRLAAKK
jgi:TRAP-type C4-dicarboxylate transport system substrate-binding protein